MNELNEIEQLRTELERVKKDRDELRQVAEIANRVRGKAMAELERVKKGAAAMREALREMRRVAVCGGSAPDGPAVACMVDELLRSQDAGRDYIHRDQVKPLVEALKLATSFPLAGQKDFEAALEHALEHARKLNLINSATP